MITPPPLPGATPTKPRYQWAPYNIVFLAIACLIVLMLGLTSPYPVVLSVVVAVVSMVAVWVVPLTVSYLVFVATGSRNLPASLAFAVVVVGCVGGLLGLRVWEQNKLAELVAAAEADAAATDEADLDLPEGVIVVSEVESQLHEINQGLFRADRVAMWKWEEAKQPLNRREVLDYVKLVDVDEYERQLELVDAFEEATLNYRRYYEGYLRRLRDRFDQLPQDDERVKAEYQKLATRYAARDSRWLEIIALNLKRAEKLRAYLLFLRINRHDWEPVDSYYIVFTSLELENEEYTHTLERAEITQRLHRLHYELYEIDRGVPPDEIP